MAKAHKRASSKKIQHLKRIHSSKQQYFKHEEKQQKTRKKHEKQETCLEVKKPHTIESKRESDPNAFPEENEAIHKDIQKNSFSSIINPNYTPKILITTSKQSSKYTYSFARELIQLFPYSTLVKRGVQFEIDKITEYCIARNYTSLIFVNENRKKPDSLTIIHLPSGPSFYFTLSSITPISSIHQHGRATSHIPELIINNFTTHLGLTVGYMFRSLFPAQPEIEGRQVVTIHNQRDFIFIRKHRYIFKNDVKVNLQELGPRFTLKLRLVQRGIYDRDKGEVVFESKSGEESNRRRFWLS